MCLALGSLPWEPEAERLLASWSVSDKERAGRWVFQEEEHPVVHYYPASTLFLSTYYVPVCLRAWTYIMSKED